MKRNVAYITKKKWGVRNKVQCKKKMHNNWTLEKTIGGKVKKLVTWGTREKNVVEIK